MLLFCIPFAFALGGFAACEDDCDHDFADTLSSDSQYHWYAATCEHTDVKGDQEPHKDADNDGVCDVCGYDGSHTHEYETEWTISQTHHWYAATCTHSVTKDKAEHVDEDNDGRCDVCLFDKGHVCEYATEYATSETQHWLATTCGHAYEKEDHVDADGNNMCDVCGYDLYTDLSNVISTVTSSTAKAKVASGSSTYEYLDWTYNLQSKVTSSYEYGSDNYTKIVNGAYGTTKHYTMLSETKGFVMNVDDSGNVTRDAYPNLDEVNGIGYSLSVLGQNAYGAEELISALYDAVSGENGSVFEYSDGCKNGTYWMSFLYFGSYNQKYVVEFKTSDDAISEVTIKIVEYGSNELVVNQKDGVVSSYYFTDRATGYCFYRYTIKQTIATRTEENPYSVDTYLFDSLTVKDSEGKTVEEGGTVTVEASDSSVFTVSFDKKYNDYQTYNTVEVTSTGSAYQDYKFGSWTGISYNSTTNTYDFSYIALKGGTYTVTVEGDRCSVSFEVVAKYKAVTSITPCVDSSYYPATTAKAFVGSPLRVTATVNSGAERKYTVTAAAADSANDNAYTLEAADIDYLFTASAEGTYTLTFTADNDTTVTATMTVTVVPAPKIDEILNGYKTALSNYGAIMAATFTPESAGATSGTVVLYGYYDDSYGFSGKEYEETVTASYYYNADQGIVLTGDNSSHFKLEFDDDFNLSMTWYYDGENTYWWYYYVSGECEDCDPVLGENTTVMYRKYTSTSDPRYLLVLNADGTGSYARQTCTNWDWSSDASATFMYTLEKTDDGYAVTFTLDSGVDCAEFDVEKTDCSITLGSLYVNNVISLTLVLDGTETKIELTWYE